MVTTIEPSAPVFVTPDELEPYRAGNAYFSYAQMIAHVSRGTEVRTGILGSGT
ncbi:hypothetical protein [Streptomyces sp. NPDC127197]|uniref:hypothetical protein n=1 Tax=Streptomyces sp. NPDC127197 TaxID=3345388 RepID=UPI00364483BC